jgi:hypothetical protein
MSARRLSNKTAREVAARIMAADPDAVIEVNGRGHLKVTGPAGFAIIPAKPKSHAVTKLRLARYAGISI